MTLINPMPLITSGEGLCSALDDYIWKAAPEISSVFVLTDTNTRRECLPLIQSCDFMEDATVLEMKPGEENKDIYSCVGLWRDLAEGGADRRSLIINLGGGVVTDLGGFVAATFKRGIRFIHVPTSLMAMVDASGGGKTGVDLDRLKNQVGVFAFPALTLIHTHFLDTLGARHLWSGFAEVIKHGLIADPRLWQLCLDHNGLLESREEDGIAFRERVIRRSVEIKHHITSADPTENGPRKVLNFGHTIGHALETWAMEQGPQLLHGEAVALGMMAEARISERQAGLQPDITRELKNLIRKVFKLPKFDKEDISWLIEIMTHDKKNVDGELRFTLIKAPGQAITDQNVGSGEVQDALLWLLEQ
jgi:3-dehydroquinate synthase